GSADISSLNAPTVDADAEGVFNLLDMSPVLLHRGYGGTDSFVKAVKEDFAEIEGFASSQSPLMGKLHNINLTLRQILSLQELKSSGEPLSLVAGKEQVETIINELNRKIDHESFSRQILLSLIREVLRARNVDEAYFDMLEVRTN